MAAAREPVALLILRVRLEPEFHSAPLRVELVRICDVMDPGEQPRRTTVADVDEACALVRALLIEQLSRVA
jgi:hypothetical protein